MEEEGMGVADRRAEAVRASGRARRAEAVRASGRARRAEAVRASGRARAPARHGRGVRRGRFRSAPADPFASCELVERVGHDGVASGPTADLVGVPVVGRDLVVATPRGGQIFAGARHDRVRLCAAGEAVVAGEAVQAVGAVGAADPVGTLGADQAVRRGGSGDPAVAGT